MFTFVPQFSLVRGCVTPVLDVGSASTSAVDVSDLWLHFVRGRLRRSPLTRSSFSLLLL